MFCKVKGETLYFSRGENLLCRSYPRGWTTVGKPWRELEVQESSDHKTLKPRQYEDLKKKKKKKMMKRNKIIVLKIGVIITST